MFDLQSKMLLLACILFCCTEQVVAQTVPKVSFEPAFRYRAHQVLDDNRGNAFASTLKVRADTNIQFRSDIQLDIQLDHVYSFNDGSYNSVVVKRDTSPIPEATGFNVNNLALTAYLMPELKLKIGRQSIFYDNERHVGSIEFWQKSQSFDALTFRFENLVGFSFDYSYVNKVNRIFGAKADIYLSKNDIRFNSQSLRPAAELGVHHHNSHLLRGRYRLSNTTSLVGYAYILDNKSLPLFSSRTFGVLLEQSIKPDLYKYTWRIEGAFQQGNSNNPVNYATYYSMLQGSVQYKSHLVELTTEYIGEDGGLPFATSLGTNHKFQGWADVFTDYNPNGGLVDFSLSYRGRIGKVRWGLTYHHFEGINGAPAIGRELDGEIAYRVSRAWEVKLVFAKYKSDSGQLSNFDSQSDLSTVFLSLIYNL